jgi:hypothetical protein
MKKIRAYLVINTSMPPENPDKIAGVFWIKRNAKNFAWQLNTESAESRAGEPYTVEKYWFASKESIAFEPN